MRIGFKTLVTSAVLIVGASSLISWRLVFSRSAYGPPQISIVGGNTYDFGELDEGRAITHNFVVKNTGSEELKILQLRSGCGCMQVSANRKTIGRGESGEIAVAYRARSVQGRDIVQAYVQTNDPVNPLQQLSITGLIRYQVFWTPQCASFYGAVGESHTTQNVKFVSGMALSQLKVKLLSVSNKWVDARVTDASTGPLVAISVSSDCPAGNSAAFVRIECSGERWNKVIDIPVYLMIH